MDLVYDSLIPALKSVNSQPDEWSEHITGANHE